ncbi:MAG: PilZ domain-containing protein [Myxococcota bacterium]
MRGSGVGDGSGPTRARRASGARHSVSDRVVLTSEAPSGGPRPPEVEGWALNISSGGLRVVVDEPLSVGDAFRVSIGDAAARAARVVWAREDQGGAVAGLAFTDEPAPNDGHG